MKQRMTFFVITVLVMTLALAPSTQAASSESGNALMTGPIALKDLDGHWSQPMVEKMLAKTIAFGFLDQTFRPDQPMSRLDVAMMLVKGLGLEAWLTAKNGLEEPLSYLDVANLTTAQQNYVKIVSGLGLMVGDSVNEFRPFDSITRKEAAVLTVRALGYEQEAKQANEGNIAFTDAGQIPNWAAAYVKTASQLGLIVGYDEGSQRFSFRPDRELTRAEMTVMISRIDGLVASANDKQPVTGTIESISQADGRILVYTKTDKPTGENVHSWPINSSAFIYVDGKKATMNKLQANMELRAMVGASGSFIYLEAGKTLLSEPSAEYRHVEGTLQNWQDNKIVLAENGATHEWGTTASTSYYLGSQSVDQAKLQSGMLVSVLLRINPDGSEVTQEIRAYSN